MAMATGVAASWRCELCGSTRQQQQLASAMSPFMGQTLGFKEQRVSIRSTTSSRIMAVASSDVPVPKRFHLENLPEGLKENYKNLPPSLYGLTPSQLDVFLVEDNMYTRNAKQVDAESISAKACYREGCGVWSNAALEGGRAMSMRASMYRAGGDVTGQRRGEKRNPPDLPSLLLDARIVYLGMNIVSAVTELLVAEILFLDFDNSDKPIYLYINSTGTQNAKRQSVGFETEAYAIVDTMKYVKSKVYTINCGVAFGQAAMILANGEKGFRAVQPNASTKLYLPKANQSTGSAIDMYIKAKELEVNAQYYIELLAKGTGKSEEEIERDIQRPRYFTGEEAVEYGLVDRVLKPRSGVLADPKDDYGFAGEQKPPAVVAGGR